ncbi:MAG: hypothetical protein KDD58_13520 [Bdellovibrionales bacterium]|nr:hypothetical protein [Bdellovibrionales bacterium]
MRNFCSQKIPRPIGDFQFLQNKQEPIYLEIGAGTGDFALNWVKKNSNDYFIAIEKTSEKFKKFINKYEAAGSPSQLIPVHANAINFIAHFVKENSVKKIFINYPNPYPKKSQANKRFHNMPFMSFLFTRLINDGEIEYATNLESIAKEATSLLTEKWNFDIMKCKKILDVNLASSAFEKKYLERGEICYRLQFKKK